MLTDPGAGGPQNPINFGPTEVTGLTNTIMQSPDRTPTAIFLVYDFSRLYDPVRRPMWTKRLQSSCAGYGDQPTATRGYVDHQTLSFHTYAKFIEDDFLRSQRVDPRTDRRPDPRPDVCECVTAPQSDDGLQPLAQALHAGAAAGPAKGHPHQTRIRSAMVQAFSPAAAPRCHGRGVSSMIQPAAHGQ